MGKEEKTAALPAISDVNAPDWLGEYGRRKWAEVVDELGQIDGLLADADRDLIAMYCEAFDEFMVATNLITKLQGEGEPGTGLFCVSRTGAPYQHPIVAVKNKALDRMRSIGKELGLSPASRSSMRLSGPETVDDEMEAFLALFKMRAT